MNSINHKKGLKILRKIFLTKRKERTENELGRFLIQSSLSSSDDFGVQKSNVNSLPPLWCKLCCARICIKVTIDGEIETLTSGVLISVESGCAASLNIWLHQITVVWIRVGLRVHLIPVSDCYRNDLDILLFGKNIRTRHDKGLSWEGLNFLIPASGVFRSFLSILLFGKNIQDTTWRLLFLA